MNDAPKKRRWLQFHLSTAVVLMFVAGGLMWANLTNTGEYDSPMWGHYVRSCGFPGRWYGLVELDDGRPFDHVNPFAIAGTCTDCSWEWCWPEHDE